MSSTILTWVSCHEKASHILARGHLDEELVAQVEGPLRDALGRCRVASTGGLISALAVLQSAEAWAAKEPRSPLVKALQSLRSGDELLDIVIYVASKQDAQATVLGDAQGVPVLVPDPRGEGSAWFRFPSEAPACSIRNLIAVASRAGKQEAAQQTYDSVNPGLSFVRAAEASVRRSVVQGLVLKTSSVLRRIPKDDFSRVIALQAYLADVLATLDRQDLAEYSGFCLVQAVAEILSKTLPAGAKILLAPRSG